MSIWWGSMGDDGIFGDGDDRKNRTLQPPLLSHCVPNVPEFAQSLVKQPDSFTPFLHLLFPPHSLLYI